MKSRFYLLDDNEIEWEGKPCVRFWGVGEKGKRICVLSNQIMPYFYFLPNEQDNLETSRQRILEDKKRFPKILSVSIESKKLLGQERRALKITCEESDVRSSYSEELQKLLGKGEGFESDLRLSARYITDLMLTPCGWNECEVSKLALDGPYDAYVATEAPRSVVDDSVPNLRILACHILTAGMKGSAKPERDPIRAIAAV
ncbi:MAG: 3'-5' exonuclease, partial [Candidatus Bathyarchaeia archaeon]